ncbi:hypothetical protein AUC68_07365 [Methyloceanibacter methanicus]|uniref:ATPase AAA-type core domain-containing protein n=1 Tax=Methyloceanibacter methanicus TaxID=1774968 RepID=A0A1E3VZM4_9HYPH|nr:ATP-binding protein [Methyloceanibacter methanicus]ODR98969.1 hypothetical protein AUC68_07365 [Methyloceanibacter methanicus]
MPVDQRFSSVRFRNYKALKNFSVQLRHFNVLVGPNNAGKSTILGAFRILAEGLRRARSRRPEPVRVGDLSDHGYRIFLENLPISTENVFTNYDEENPAKIEFKLSDGNELHLIFPEVGVCYLICNPVGRPVRTPAVFKSTYTATIGFVPVLGPVEHDEPLYKSEAARQALLTHRASRNFRNIWYHFGDKFDEFRTLVRETWPGMDIERPEPEYGDGKATLRMFCPEERYPREIFWAGFGFQVWCQMLTYVLRSESDSLLIIDEPDIYLHSDLQRQLLNILTDLGPDILIATHSTEIITEADPGDILIVHKKSQSAKRIKDPAQLQNLFEVLGSNLNPTLTQLAKSRRAVFVEGKDFQLLSSFARKAGIADVATRADFAVIPMDGFIPNRIDEYSKGIELTLGVSILKSVIFDRDYRSASEIKKLCDALKGSTEFVHFHDRKELENFLLEQAPLQRAIKAKVGEHSARTGKVLSFDEDIGDLLLTLTDQIKQETSGIYISQMVESEKRTSPTIDRSTLTTRAVKCFEEAWGDSSSRLKIVPGKKVFSMLNAHLQEHYGVSLTPVSVATQFRKEEIPQSMLTLLQKLNEFRTTKPGTS